MSRRAAPALLFLVTACADAANESASAASGPSLGSASAAQEAAPASPTATNPFIPNEEPGIVPPKVQGQPDAVADENTPWRAPPAAEAERRTLLRLPDEPALAPHEALLTEHFKGYIPFPLEVQTLSLPGARKAFLLYGHRLRREPFVVVLDSSNKVLWTKERPLAGTRGDVAEIVLLPGPRGEVFVLWFDTPTGFIALRKWGPMGEVLADFALAEVSASDALSGMYLPGSGWIAVASQLGSARAQMLDEQGQLAFGPRGVDLPWAAKASAPVAIAADTEKTVVLCQAGDARHGATGAAPDHVLCARYDAHGKALWPAPVDLGAAPPEVPGAQNGGNGSSPRIVASRLEGGGVKVSLGWLSNVVSSEGLVRRAP